MSGTRVGSGTCASSAWRAIGASTPSMSRSTPLRAGSARSGAIASDSVADTDTGEVSRMRRPTPRRAAAFAAASGARSDGRPRRGDYQPAPGGGADARAGAGPTTMPRMAGRRTLELAAIGTAAGLFSGLFGVGGGAVIVPMLVMRMRYGDREAMGTSLAAIAVMAGAAMLAHGAYGNLHVGDGLLVGVPAVGGVVAGTWLQQRVPVRTVRLLFAAVLVVAAVDLALR